MPTYSLIYTDRRGSYPWPLTCEEISATTMIEAHEQRHALAAELGIPEDEIEIEEVPHLTVAEAARLDRVTGVVGSRFDDEDDVHGSGCDCRYL